MTGKTGHGLKKWWQGPESNWRHKDFQSSALPTELPRHETIGVPVGTRTPNLLVRSQVLYPIELQVRIFKKQRLIYQVVVAIQMLSHVFFKTSSNSA